MFTLTDQIYSEPSGIPLHFDLFKPDAESVLPLVICIHGGGWISGEKEGMHDVAVGLVKAGFAVACPQYRLAPLHTYPAGIEDVCSFVEFARTNSESLRIHPGRIATLGNSAGGHLALIAGIKGCANAIVDICGITQIATPDIADNPISLTFVEQFMGSTLSEKPEDWQAASPINLISNENPEMLIIHGDADDIVPISQSELLVEELKRCGVSHEFHVMPEEGHSFTYETWEKIEEMYIRFLKSKLTA